MDKITKQLKDLPNEIMVELNKVVQDYILGNLKFSDLDPKEIKDIENKVRKGILKYSKEAEKHENDLSRIMDKIKTTQPWEEPYWEIRDYKLNF